MNTTRRSYARALVVGLVLLGALPAVPAGAAHLALSQTTYDPTGARYLSSATTFAVTHPQTGAIETREFKYTTPENFATRTAGSVNVWFVFHGGGGDMNTMNRYFRLIPPSSPTVLVFPEALVQAPFNATRWRNVQTSVDITDPDAYRDIIFVEQLLDDLLAANPQLSGDHVYASGFSSGGAATWMLLCYRSSRFAGFGIYSMQLHTNRRDGGCGDGLAPGAGGAYSITTGYEILTGQAPDLYGYNPAIPSTAPTKPVFYHHGTLDGNIDYSGAPGCFSAGTCPPGEDPNSSMTGPGTTFEDRDDIASVAWLLERHDLRNKSNLVTVPDQDPLAGTDVVTTYARRYKKSRGSVGVTSRRSVMWFELDGHVHALSALDHLTDVCDNVPPPGQSPCNANPNASKDFDTPLANQRFFENHAGMLR